MKKVPEQCYFLGSAQHDEMHNTGTYFFDNKWLSGILLLSDWQLLFCYSYFVLYCTIIAIMYKSVTVPVKLSL